LVFSFFLLWQGRTRIFEIHARTLSVEKHVRWELLARLCPNTTGAEIRSVCTEAGMFALRDRRKVVSEKDLLEAINKVIKGTHTDHQIPQSPSHSPFVVCFLIVVRRICKVFGDPQVPAL